MQCGIWMVSNSKFVKQFVLKSFCFLQFLFTWLRSFGDFKFGFVPYSILFFTFFHSPSHSLHVRPTPTCTGTLNWIAEKYYKVWDYANNLMQLITFFIKIALRQWEAQESDLQLSKEIVCVVLSAKFEVGLEKLKIATNFKNFRTYFEIRVTRLCARYSR